MAADVAIAVRDFTSLHERMLAAEQLRRISRSMLRHSAIERSHSCKLLQRPTSRIHYRIAEDVDEEDLSEGAKLGEGSAALGPQRLCPVQHVRNPPLFHQ